MIELIVAQYGPTTLNVHAQAVFRDVNNLYHYYLPKGDAVALLIDNNSSAALVAQLRQLTRQYEATPDQERDMTEAISTKFEAWLNSAASRNERSEYGSIMTYDSAETVTVVRGLRKQPDTVESEKAELERSLHGAETLHTDLADQVWDLRNQLRTSETKDADNSDVLFDPD